MSVIITVNYNKNRSFLASYLLNLYAYIPLKKCLRGQTGRRFKAYDYGQSYGENLGPWSTY